MQFSNSTIDVEQLAPVQVEAFTRLEPAYKKVIFYENAIFSIVLIGLLSGVYFRKGYDEFQEYWLIPAVGLGLFILFIFWFRPRAFRKKSYQLRERDIVYRSGLWWQSETVIPFVRVQHSAVTQGPLGRIFGFSSLKLFTAGGSKSDLVIPGLAPDNAAKLEQFISQKAGLDAEE